MPSVTVFNTSALSITVQVNNGPLFTCPGANPPGLSPQSPSSGGPGWSNTSLAPNTFAPGANHLVVIPQGSMQPLSAILQIPGHFPWAQVQLYLFPGPGVLGWALLNNGSLVTGNLPV